MDSTRRTHLPSSYACKLTMAVTGVVLGAFLLVHMLGNLKVYVDPEGFDHYAQWLRTAFSPLLPHESLLWIFRIVLGTSLIAHVACAVILFARGRRARGPHRRKLPWRSFAARTMPVTGLVLFGFIIFHLLDLTTGQAAAPGFVETTAEQSAAYANLVASLARPWVGGFYLATMLLLWAHLAHGLWTVVQDLGITGRRVRAVLAAVAGGWALLVMAGNASIPLAVWLGVLQ
ncbi:MAG TPA: succinate dehydrogenase cytochrome b subunit [Propionibacteriaceae bacterium]|nr:succinate dehydrogenase cytochrome b subunit [Propionibacteriaceae bacterium]